MLPLATRPLLPLVTRSLLVLGLIGPAAAGAADTTEVLRAAAKDGVVSLSEVPALAASLLAEVELEAPRVTDSGAALGEVRLLGARARAVLHPLRTGIDGGAQGWAVAFDASAGRLSDLLPPLAGTPVEDLRLGRTALVLSTANARVDEATLSDEVRDFYRDSFGNGAHGTGRFMLDLASGVNLLTRVDVDAASPTGWALERLGIDASGVLLQGTILKDASFKEFKEAREKGELQDRLRESMELAAYLPPLAIGGLPAGYDTGEARLVVTGKPGVGVAFRLVSPGDTVEASKVFECRVDVARSEGLGGAAGSELQVTGTALGHWRDAFGLRGFDLVDPRLLLEIDAQQRVGFGVRAGIAIGSRDMAVAAKLQLHAVTGAPVGGFFEGRLESIGSADLVAFANAVGAARGKQPIDASATPEFELRDMYLRFAPTEGDSDLGVEEGYALRGELHAFDTRFAYVDGEISFSGLVPSIRVAGECGDVDLGALALRDAAVDVNLGLTLDQHFRVSGETRILGLVRGVDVDCGLDRLHLETWTELGGVYRTQLALHSPSAGAPRWTLAAELQNDLTRTLAEKVAPKIEGWARESNQSHAKAEANLVEAQREVARLDVLVERARRVVRSERAQKQARYTAAQEKLSALDRAIEHQRSLVRSDRAETTRKVAGKKRARDAAKKRWQKAVRARKAGKPWEKPGLRAKEAAAYADYVAKNTAYGTANTAARVAHSTSIDADPRVAAVLAGRGTLVGALEAAKKLVDTFPVDTDARVASVLTARHTATAALELARGAVRASDAVTGGGAKAAAWLAKNNGEALMIDDARFEGRLESVLAGSSVEVVTRVRFLGDSKTLRVRLSPEALSSGKLTQALTDGLWRQLRDA